MENKEAEEKLEELNKVIKLREEELKKTDVKKSWWFKFVEPSSIFYKPPKIISLILVAFFVIGVLIIWLLTRIFNSG